MLEETPRCKIQKVEEKEEANWKKIVKVEFFFSFRIWVAIEIDFDAVMWF